MMSKSVKTDVLRVALGNFILAAVEVALFALFGFFSLEVIFGALLGAAFVSLSFLWLAFSVSKNVEKDPENARKRVSASYTYRLLAACIMIIVAVKAPLFNPLAAIIPLLYQRIVVTVVGNMRCKEDGKKEVVSE